MKKTLRICTLFTALAAGTAGPVITDYNTANAASGSTACGQTGKASWYGPGFHGRRTANGETFNMNAMTAAHKTLPFGTRILVTYNDKSVEVRINDRGPYINGRIIDLSKAAAKEIGIISKGTGVVTLSCI